MIQHSTERRKSAATVRTLRANMRKREALARKVDALNEAAQELLQAGASHYSLGRLYMLIDGYIAQQAALRAAFDNVYYRALESEHTSN